MDDHQFIIIARRSLLISFILILRVRANETAPDYEKHIIIMEWIACVKEPQATRRWKYLKRTWNFSVHWFLISFFGHENYVEKNGIVIIWLLFTSETNWKNMKVQETPVLSTFFSNYKRLCDDWWFIINKENSMVIHSQPIHSKKCR